MSNGDVCKAAPGFAGSAKKSLQMSKMHIMVLGMKFYVNFMHMLCIKKVFCMPNLVPHLLGGYFWIVWAIIVID